MSLTLASDWQPEGNTMSLPPDTSTFLYLSDEQKLEQIRQEMDLPVDARIILMEATIGEDQRDLEKRAREVAELPENAGAYIVLSHSNDFAYVQSTGETLEDFDTLIAESRVHYQQRTHRERVAEIFSLEEEAQNYVYDKEHHKLEEWLTGFADFILDVCRKNTGEDILVFYGKWNGHQIRLSQLTTLSSVKQVSQESIQSKLQEQLKHAQEKQQIASTLSQLQYLGRKSKEKGDNIETPIQLFVWLHNICREERSRITDEEKKKMGDLIDKLDKVTIEEFIGNTTYPDEVEALKQEYNTFQTFLGVLADNLNYLDRNLDTRIAKNFSTYIKRKYLQYI